MLSIVKFPPLPANWEEDPYLRDAVSITTEEGTHKITISVTGEVHIPHELLTTSALVPAEAVANMVVERLYSDICELHAVISERVKQARNQS